MVDIPLARSDYFRSIAKEARLRMRNRYFEQNPSLTEQQVALLARMGMKRWLSVGDGPIRGVYSQPGSFDDDLFVVSYDKLYRITKEGTSTLVGTVQTDSLRSSVSMVATSNFGSTPAYLFIACGATFYVYIEDGYATGTVSGTPVNNDTVTVGTTYYKFTNGSVDAGAPAGTLANPWLVALGASTAEAWENFYAALGATGTAGTQYSTALTENASVATLSFTSISVSVRAADYGSTGNLIATTETGAGIGWTAATLTGGGSPSLTQIATPDDIGVIRLGYIASYVVVVPAQGQGVNGRFYWIRPGETTIDPLDFATAERAPDPIHDVIVFGDQFWLPGTSTTEVWYFTGDPDAPVLRMQGVVFDRGTWEGTAIQVKDSMIIVDNLGSVYQISGSAKKISRPDIEERIRQSIAAQAASPLF